ncbi:hypothetical protein, partial [Streptomyces olivaceoviridis]
MCESFGVRGGSRAGDVVEDAASSVAELAVRVGPVCLDLYALRGRDRVAGDLAGSRFSSRLGVGEVRACLGLVEIVSKGVGLVFRVVVPGLLDFVVERGRNVAGPHAVVVPDDGVIVLAPEAVAVVSDHGVGVGAVPARGVGAVVVGAGGGGVVAEGGEGG